MVSADSNHISARRRSRNTNGNCADLATCSCKTNLRSPWVNFAKLVGKLNLFGRIKGRHTSVFNSIDNCLRNVGISISKKASADYTINTFFDGLLTGHFTNENTNENKKVSE